MSIILPARIVMFSKGLRLSWLALVCVNLYVIYLLGTGPPPPLTEDVFLPELPLIPIFHLDNASYSAFDASSDNLWQALVPGNSGYALATNLSSGLHYWAQISMFHQLECLRDLRQAFKSVLFDWDASQSYRQDHTAHSSYSHISRCFDYVRQGLYCHADASLHPVAHPHGAPVDIVDGNALWTVCRDSNALYDWALRSGMPHKSWLIHEEDVPSEAEAQELDDEDK